MKTVAALVVAGLLMIPGVALAGPATDAALGLGAFAVFNQILSGTGIFAGVTGAPAVVAPQPVIVTPPPVYVAPPPVYVAPPPPVYYAPRPVVVAPAPVYVRPAPVYTYPVGPRFHRVDARRGHDWRWEHGQRGRDWDRH